MTIYGLESIGLLYYHPASKTDSCPPPVPATPHSWALEPYVANDTGTSPCTLAPVFVNAAQAIAGDGAAVKISRPLQEVLDGERI